MRILRLTNSQDLNPLIPEDRRAWSIAEHVFEAQTGERAETIIKIIWPGPELPGIVDGWMERYQPEIVVLHVSGLWFTYDSSLAKLDAGSAPSPLPPGRRLPASISTTGSRTTRSIAPPASLPFAPLGASPFSPRTK